jgi:hypothetical protein
MLENTIDDVTIPMALEHTAIAMLTVFTVLILISFIIYLLKYVPILLNRMQKKEPAEAVASRQREDSVPQQNKNLVSQDTAPRSESGNDGQIIAVIAAAIAAQMTEETGVTVAPEGLVIRSIKKRTF